MRRSAIIRWRNSVMRSSVVKGQAPVITRNTAPHDGAGQHRHGSARPTWNRWPYEKELPLTTLPRSGLVQLVLDLLGIGGSTRDMLQALAAYLRAQRRCPDRVSFSNLRLSAPLGQPGANQFGCARCTYTSAPLQAITPKPPIV